VHPTGFSAAFVGRSPATPFSTVLFDLGGVVCEFSHDRRLAALARVSRLSVEEVHHRLFASGFDLDCDRGHYTLEQQCAQICARLDVICSQHELAAFWAEAFAPDADVLAIVRRVRSRAVTGILTNNGPLVDLMLRELFPDVAAAFDHPCFSYQAMSTKPEPRVYLATLERLGVTPEQCVFVDDAEQNVQGARAVGIDSVRFVSAQTLATALQERQLV
jgi:HAD superfamily hydrolase (TIGR01509 family)